MILHLSPAFEARLRTLASQQGRDMQSLAEEAISQYFDAADLTDLTADQIGQLQMRLAPSRPASVKPPRLASPHERPMQPSATNQ